MKTGMAILTTLGFLFAMVVLGGIDPVFLWAIFLTTSVWASIDASRISMKKYQLNGPAGPISTLLGCLLLWIVVFPWYLVNKGKIARGEMPLKDKDAEQARTGILSSQTADNQGIIVANLEKLARLKDTGVLTDEEFQLQKAKLLQ